MHQSVGVQKSYNSTSLRDGIARYTDDKFPEHRLLTIDAIQHKTAESVHGLHRDEAGLIAFMGYPGVGKSSHMPPIREAVEHSLGLHVRKQEFFRYLNPNGEMIEVGGYAGSKGSSGMAMVHADHFFRAIGADRRGMMLEDIPSCRRNWGNLQSALKMTRDVFSGRPTDVRLFLGTEQEKLQKQGAGTIELVTTQPPTGKKIIIAEGVNVGEWADRIKKIEYARNNTSIKITKILFDMSIEDSLIRVLRRDHDKKGYTFYNILDHRLPEYYYILKLYIEPALQDPETLLLDKSRHIPPFLEEEKYQILSALNILQKKYINSTVPGNTEQAVFIYTLIHRLRDSYSRIPSISREEMRAWRQRKELKRQKSQR